MMGEMITSTYTGVCFPGIIHVHVGVTYRYINYRICGSRWSENSWNYNFHTRNVLTTFFIQYTFVTQGQTFLWRCCKNLLHKQKFLFMHLWQTQFWSRWKICQDVWKNKDFVGEMSVQHKRMWHFFSLPWEIFIREIKENRLLDAIFTTFVIS